MKIHILINTYNRPEFLAALVADLLAEREKTPFTFSIHNDGGTPPTLDIPESVGWVVNWQHHGKQRYWQLTNQIYKSIPAADAYIQMPDDMKFEPGFVAKAVKQWQNLQKNDPRAVCLNLFTDLSRLGRANWTKTTGRPVLFGNHRYIKTQWVDMCYIAGRQYFQEIHPIRKIDPIRWRLDPALSSGVGMQISSRLNDKGFNLYQCRFSMLQHLGDESQMNKAHRKTTPLTANNDKLIVAGIATLKARRPQLEKTIESLLRSVDTVFVMPNDYTPTEKANRPGLVWLQPDKDRGDTNKFLPLTNYAPAGCVYLSCDDDIIYPESYGWDIYHALNANPRRIVGIHGKVIHKPPIDSFYGRKNRVIMHHCTSANKSDAKVNLIGTGTAGFDTSVFVPKIEEFKNNNMADIYFSMQGIKAGLPLVCLKRPANYVKIQQVKDTIFDRHQSNDKVQTDLYNSFKGW